jgi:hypothetical protein
MPIKFRCHQCRQFLGISRSQAGGVVDCPTCGRTIRVPDLDGTVKPLPKPKLDPKDSKLAAALNELASISDPDEAFTDSPANAERETPVPKSDSMRRPSPILREFVVLGTSGEPLDFDSLPPREGIPPEEAAPNQAAVQTVGEVVQAPPVVKLPDPPMDPPIDPPQSPVNKFASLPDDDSMKQDRPWSETAQPGDSWNQLISASTEAPDSDSASAQSPDAHGAEQQSKLETTSSPATSRPGVPGGLSTGLLIALSGLAAAIFALGFWVGRVTTIPAAPSEKTPAADSPGNNDPAGQQEAGSPDNPIGVAKPALRGRITFLSDGQRKPDRGARLLVLPKDRSGSVKLGVVGFRSGDSPEDHRVAVAALVAMGGAFATTSDEGEFEISLLSSGQYYVLVLSNSLTRDGDEIDANVESAATPYFDRPSQLVGRVRCYVEEVRWSGDGTEPWDHSFRS